MPIQQVTEWKFKCSYPDCTHEETGEGRFIRNALPEGSLRITKETLGKPAESIWLCSHHADDFEQFLAGVPLVDSSGEPQLPPDVTPIVTEPTPEGPYAIYETQADWGGSYHAKIIVHTDEQLNDWIVEFDSADVITNVWDGQLISADNGHYVFGPPDYNKVVAAGSTAAINFQANGSASIEPTNLVVNKLA